VAGEFGDELFVTELSSHGILLVSSQPVSSETNRDTNRETNREAP